MATGGGPGTSAPPITAGVSIAATSTSPPAISTAAPDGSPTPLPIAELQARLDELRVENHVPGVSVTIIWPDGRKWTGVSGWADLAQRIPVVPGTAFSIGSVSKTFLAALVLELVEEDRLSLDDRVIHWLPTARVSGEVTIRELLDHTSGLYDFFSNPTIDAAILAHKQRTWTPARALSYMRGPYCLPVGCWHYSNSNYVILGQVVQRVTGHTVAAELRRRFIDPLGLRRTFVQAAEQRRGTVATSYQVLGPIAHVRTVSQTDGTTISPFTSVVTAAGAAGAMAASSRDLAVWARRLYGGAVLQPDSLAAMLDVSASQAVGAPVQYGLGVSEASFGGRWTEGHNGRLVGAGASIRYLPESGFTVAVATNQDRVGPDLFGTALLDMLIPPPPPPTPVPSPGPTASLP
jgi:D-alanyl-D-alanine carboxypeptidase